MDRQRFAEAIALAGERQRGGIGTLGEKTLHAALKYYFEPYAPGHEVKLGGFVADAVGEQGIIEIQTQGFWRLRKKLNAFLPVAPVTVVYPVPAIRWVRRINPETGETAGRRKSPKRSGPCALLPELYGIKSLLHHPNLTFHILLLEVEDLRPQGERGRSGGRIDRIPLALLDEAVIRTPQDYELFLPEALPPLFTSRDYQQQSRLPLSGAQAALGVLHEMGVLERTGRRGRSWEYRRAQPLAGEAPEMENSMTGKGRE